MKSKDSHKDTATLKDLRKILKEGDVILIGRHKKECCTHYTAIHACNCGIEAVLAKARKLVSAEEKNEEVEWDHDTEHYDYD
jgi:hypothetical protein